MANRTKKLAVHANPAATVRVYMDLPSQTNASLEVLAQSSGRTKKGQLEFLINEAVAEYQAKEIETGKRARALLKKGKK